MFTLDVAIVDRQRSFAKITMIFNKSCAIFKVLSNWDSRCNLGSWIDWDCFWPSKRWSHRWWIQQSPRFFLSKFYFCQVLLLVWLAELFRYHRLIYLEYDICVSLKIFRWVFWVLAYLRHHRGAVRKRLSKVTFALRCVSRDKLWFGYLAMPRGLCSWLVNVRTTYLNVLVITLQEYVGLGHFNWEAFTWRWHQYRALLIGTCSAVGKRSLLSNLEAWSIAIPFRSLFLAAPLLFFKCPIYVVTHFSSYYSLLVIVFCYQ